MVAFHVALYAALAVSSPFWIFFMGGFILPALNLKERSVIFSWLGWSVFLFLVGVLSTYFFLLPVALRASVQYSELLGFSAAGLAGGRVHQLRLQVHLRDGARVPVPAGRPLPGEDRGPHPRARWRSTAATSPSCRSSWAPS